MMAGEKRDFGVQLFVKKILVSAAVVLGAVLVFFIVSRYLAYRHEATINSGGPYYPKASVNSGTSSATSSSVSDSPAKPLPKSSAPAASVNGSITITSPTSGGAVESGTVVTGTASDVKEVYFRLKGSKSGQLAEGQVATSGGAFSFPLAFMNQAVAGDTGTLEVYTLDSKNGNEIDNASVPVYIKG